MLKSDQILLKVFFIISLSIIRIVSFTSIILIIDYNVLS